MSKKLYVGNLPFSAEEDDVRDLFEEYGTVESIAMISDRETGQFRGFCFIEMPNEDANAAIAGLDGKDFGGRNLRVNEAKPREERSGGGNRGGGGQRRSNNYSGGGNRRW